MSPKSLDLFGLFVDINKLVLPNKKKIMRI